MLALTRSDLLNLLPPKALIAAAEAAVVALENGQAIAPQRQHIDWNGNTLLTMPAIAGDRMGVKLVSVVPGNAGRDLPVVTGLMVLSSGETGLPLALMNAGALTAQRTGAIGALGVKYMTPDDMTSVGIVGCGVQSVWQAICACAVRPIHEIFCFSRSAASFEKFASAVQPRLPGIRLTRCESGEQLLDRTRLIITATTSSQPVLPDDPGRLEGKHFISVGSFKPSMQELPDAVYRLAGGLAIDSDAAREEVGDVLNPIRKGILAPEQVFHIGQLVTGRRAVDITKTTAYKSVGMALYDLYIAQALYAEAQHRGIGREIEL